MSRVPSRQNTPILLAKPQIKNGIASKAFFFNPVSFLLFVHSVDLSLLNHLLPMAVYYNCFIVFGARERERETETETEREAERETESEREINV